MAFRLANIHAHLAPGAPGQSVSLPTTQPAAGVLKWLSGLFGGGSDEEDGLEITPVATRDSHPGQTWGHAHPDIVQTAVRPHSRHAQPFCPLPATASNPTDPTSPHPLGWGRMGRW